MVAIIVGYHFEGSWYMFKNEIRVFLIKNNRKITKIGMMYTLYSLGSTAFRVHVRVQFKNLTWFDQKVKKNKIKMITPIRVHLIGC